MNQTSVEIDVHCHGIIYIYRVGLSDSEDIRLVDLDGIIPIDDAMYLFSDSPETEGPSGSTIEPADDLPDRIEFQDSYSRKKNRWTFLRREVVDREDGLLHHRYLVIEETY